MGALGYLSSGWPTKSIISQLFRIVFKKSDGNDDKTVERLADDSPTTLLV
jgi:hypothetical protein